MKVGAVIQARTGSSRLPRKVMKPILGKPMIAHQIDRIRLSRLIDEIIVATTTSPEDDELADLCAQLGIACFRGSEHDVIGRVADAVRTHAVDLHVEFHGDAPLPDALIVDQVIGYALKHAQHFDYVSNALTTTYPPGIEVWVYPSHVLLDAERRADPSLREHVGVHIHRHPDRYRLANLAAPPNLQAPDVYLEVDTAEDFALISRIFEHFHPQAPTFGLSDVLTYLRDNPELAATNRTVYRRWKALQPDH